MPTNENIYYFSQRGYVIPTFTYLSVCWFVSRIRKKVTGGFGWNFHGRLDFLAVIWISI